MKGQNGDRISQRNMETLSMQAVMELGKAKFQLQLKLGRICER